MERLLRYIQQLLMILLCLVVFAACNDEETVVWSEISASGIYVNLALGSEKAVSSSSQVTRAEQITGETGWGENSIESVDYFLFSASGTKLLYKRQTAQATGSTLPTTSTTINELTYYATEPYPLSTGADWSTLYTQLTAGCSLYAIVNLDETKANGITDLASLKALVVTDEDIYKRVEDKRFLMDGKHTFTGN